MNSQYGCRSDPQADIFNIDADMVAEVGNLVHEGDLVASMALLTYLVISASRTPMLEGCGRSCGRSPCTVRASTRAPEGIGADDDPVRFHEILNGRPLLEEFGLLTTSNSMVAPRRTSSSWIA